MSYTGQQKRDYDRIWIAARRADWFSDKKCARCGSTERLELDHIDPALKISSKIWSWAEHRRTTELAKCQVLCHDCHLDKTLNEDIARAKCGSNSKYQSGCRCQDCKDAHAVVNARYR